LFPGLDIKSSLYPSSILFSPNHSKQLLLNRALFSFPFMPDHRPNELFRVLWDIAAEQHYFYNLETYQKVADCLHSTLSLSPAYNSVRNILSASSEHYNAVHVRRGDKTYNQNPEAIPMSLDTYIKYIRQACNTSDLIYLFGDSSLTLQTLHDKLLCEGYQKVEIMLPHRTDNKSGYNQLLFNTMTLQERIEYNRSFMHDFGYMTNAHVFIGSFSSCVGRSAALLRNFKRSYSVDTRFSIVQ
jgi:hypothetical protein